MTLGNRVRTWVARQVPADVPEVERPRTEVFIITGWLGLLLSMLSAVMGMLVDLTVMASINIVDIAVCALVLRWYTQGRPEGRSNAVRFFIGYFTIALSFGVISVNPMDMSTLCFLFLMPLIASLMLDAKETPVWFAVPMVTGAIVLLLGDAGYQVKQVDPSPVATHLLNFLGAFLLGLALLRALASERERAVERIRQTERVKSAFFANVGHDIRTPMNGVLGTADVLLEHDLGDEERELVKVIKSSGEVLLGLIDDVLDLSRIEAGELVVRPGPLSVFALVAEMKGLWLPVATRKGLTLRSEIGADVPKVVRLDGVRVRQVFNNLISNAVKFTERGSVVLRVSRQGERLVFAVEDTGIGISLAQQERLFQRFAQADDERARKNQGSGLGLALSRQLAQLMGGGLRLESAVGAGSRFWCELPCIEDVMPEQASVTRHLPPGLQVLVVDDNPVNRLVAERLLGRSGCAVHVVSDGRAATEAVASRRFDVVLMDVHMPQMDGLEATRIIRAGPGEQPRIIGLSASAAQDDVDSCRRAGMNDFLAKPVTQERLIATLLRHL